MNVSASHLALAGLVWAVSTVVVAAQPFESGPPGTVVGSSAANMRIGGAPRVEGRRIRGADVFGDTVEERAWGRDFDDGHLRPRVRGPRVDEGSTVEERASAGRSALDPLNAGTFARSPNRGIARSAVTRPALGGRRTNSRAIIRRD